MFSRIPRLPRYLKLVLVWNPLAALFFIGMSGSFHDFWSRFFLGLTISESVSSLISFLVALLIWIEASYFKVQKLPAPPPNRARIRTIAALGMLPGLYVGFIFAGMIAEHFGWKWDAPHFADYTSGIVFGLCIFAIIILIDLWNAAKSAKQAAELHIKELENERLQAQLSALTAQMNPHLLFNALNTIASMIPSDPEGAEEVTVKLSELYRGARLESQELAFVG